MKKAVAVPELIIVGGRDTVGGTVKPYNFYKRYHAQGALGLPGAEQYSSLLHHRYQVFSSTGFNR